MVRLVSQDISVAGRRAGMKNTIMGDDESTRSGLFFDAIRIVKEMRNESIKRLSSGGSAFDIRCVQPRYTIYENVPGCFSSNNGEDFRAVLEETIKVVDENAYVPQLEKGQKWATAGCIVGDGYSVAWRLHDAQFWGVPQRRKRICVLADYGGGTAPEILFELVGETDDAETFKAITDIREKSKSEVQTECNGLSGNTEPSIKKGQATTELATDSFGESSSYTLKIRGGVDIDSHGKRAGKGALVQTELSGTLGVSQDQTLITGCNQNKNFFLNARSDENTYEKDSQIVCYGLDRASFNQGKNAQFGFAVDKELAPPIVAKGPGGIFTMTQSEPCVQEITRE